jgi:outer membrane protein assembly factor BamB
LVIAHRTDTISGRHHTERPPGNFEADAMTRYFDVVSLTLMAGLVASGLGFQALGMEPPEEISGDTPVVQVRNPAPDLKPPRYDPSVFRGGPSRIGDLGDLTLPGNARLLWRFDFEQGIGDAIVSDGVVYVTGDKGTVFAMKADGSGVVWQDDRQGRHFAGAPSVVGDRMYIATGEGLSALNRANGSTIWDYAIAGGACESSPLEVGGRILVAGYDGFIHAVNGDGSAAWKHDLVSDAPKAPPGFDQERAVITGNAARPRTMASDGTSVLVPVFDQSRVVAVDVATGNRRWSFQSKGWMFAEPTITEDSVFVTSQDKSLYCLDKTNGDVRWSFPTRWRVESGVAIRDGSAYFGSCDGFFYRIDIKTGKSVWAFETPRGGDGKHFPIYSSPVASEDAVCFGSFDGNLYALKTADGSLKWKVRPVEGAEVSSSPSTDGRRVFATVRYDQFKQAGANSLIAVGD